MKVKVREASGTVLDWMVAKCEETRTRYQDYRTEDGQLHVMYCDIWLSTAYAPSTNWAQGGPILTREHISRTIDHSGLWIAYWTDGYTDGDEGKKWMQCDRSELIAALRCYVASTLGEEVEVPDALA